MHTKRLMAAAALALSDLAVPALAGDGKTMSGGACQARTDDDLPFLSRSTSSGVSSSGPNNVFIVCPVTKDIAAGRVKRAEVVVIDRSVVFDVSCTVASNRRDGSVQHFQTLRSTGVSGAVQTLRFGGQPAVANGSYNLDCVFPPRDLSFGGSSVVMYTIVEE